MRRTVKQNKAPAKKAASSGVTFYGPDRATVSGEREREGEKAAFVPGARPLAPTF